MEILYPQLKFSGKLHIFIFWWCLSLICENMDLSEQGANQILWTDFKLYLRGALKNIFIRIYTVKSRPSTPKRQRCLYILCSIFYHVSASHEFRHLILPLLFRSSSSPPTVRCPLVNLLWSTTIFLSKEVSIPFQLPS